VSDNASTDSTAEIVACVAAEDPRVKLHRNPENIGQNPNFNRVLELAEGTYFRWIGMDDRLDAFYARKCVEALEDDPNAIGVTTYQRFHDDDGNEYYAEYVGERLDAIRPSRRFARSIWFCSADYRYMDLIYTMYRRDALMASRKLRIVPAPDQMLAVELALQGRIIHIPECLAMRRRVPSHYVPALADEYQHGYGDVLRAGAWTFSRVAWQSCRDVPMDLAGRAECLAALSGHIYRRTRRLAEHRIRSAMPRPIKQAVKRLLAGTPGRSPR
jgi:glycosyltransferase involved in cell wall biosynthesis